MASITISELRPAGSELFQDSESFLNELSDGRELDSVEGASSTLILSVADGGFGLTLGFDGPTVNPNAVVISLTFFLG